MKTARIISLVLAFIVAIPCYVHAGLTTVKDQSDAYFSISIAHELTSAGDMTVVYWPHYLLGIDNPTDKQSFRVTLSADNRYEFRLKGVSGDFGRVLLMSNATGTLFNKQIVEPGDSVVVNEHGKLSGKGFEKYVLWNENNVDTWSWDLYNLSKQLQPRQFKEAIDTALLTRYRTLDKHKAIHSTTRQILKFDLRGEVLGQMLYLLQLRYEKEVNLRPAINRIVDELLQETISKAGNEYYSSFYLEYLLKLQLFNLIIQNDGEPLSGTTKFTYQDLYLKVRDTYKGNVRDKLLTMLIGLGYAYATFEFNGIDADEYTLCMRDAMERIRNNKLKEFVRHELETRGKGARAFDFSVTDSLGNKVRLSDFRGKAVLLDIWMAPCGGCQVFQRFFGKEIYPVTKDYNDFVVISVSSNDRDEWLKELDHHSWPYFINAYTDGLRFEHPLMKHYNVMAFPFLLLLDKSGRVVSSTIQLEGKDALLSLINEARAAK